MITAVVLTKNEEKNIKECLNSLKWCDEIIVIDDYSKDKTINKVRKFESSKVRNGKTEIKIFKRYLNGDFADQRNFGLSKAQSDWVLFIDADERISEKLAKEIVFRVSPACRQGRCSVSRVNGYFLKRKDFIFGQWLNNGETASVKLLRLARRNCGKWERKVDEVWKVQGKIGQLKNPILHYPHQNLTEFLKSINYFSTLNARVFYEQGKRTTFLEWLKPGAKFIQNYFFRLGFLDGTAGFVHAMLMSLHSFLVRAKLFMLWKNL